MSTEIFDWPAGLPRVRELRWGLEDNTRSFESPFTGSEQIVDTLGAKWVCELTFGRCSPAEGRALAAFLAQLGGRRNRVRLWDMSMPAQPQYGNPQVTEAIAMRRTLTTRGWSPSTDVLPLGGWIQIGTGLYQVVKAVRSAGTGTATITVEPALRESYQSGEPIVVSKPCGLFRIDSATAYNIRRSGFRHDVGSIKFREALT